MSEIRKGKNSKTCFKIADTGKFTDYYTEIAFSTIALYNDFGYTARYIGI